MIVGTRTFQHVDQLEKLVRHLATQYDKGACFDFDDIEVSDPEYDALYRELKKLKPNSEAFKGTTPSNTTPTGGVVVHDPPMTSINKADGDEKLKIYQNWLDDCAKRLGTEVKIVQAYKHDGVAIRINYVDGKFHSAGSRPRGGILGTDVTEHAKWIKGVPQKLPKPYTLSLNGEIECLKPTFHEINARQEANGEDQYKNPRNYTAGVMGRDDIEQVKDAGLTVCFYSITGFDNWHKYYSNEVERAKWANQDGLKLDGQFVQVRPHRFEDLQTMEDYAKKLDYEVDGVVLKVNDLEQQEQLGHHGDDPIKEPRAALAWKFAEEIAVATIDHIELNGSRTGRVVPKAIFVESVNLADTEVSQATCNNIGWVKAMKLGPGAVVQVKKAGKIIPNICGVVQEGKPFDVPTQCPSCQQPTTEVVSPSGCEDLMCYNPECPAKHIKSYVFYFQTLGAKGLGEALIEQILSGGKVKEFADFYELDVEDLEAAGLSTRQALLAQATIHGVKPDKDDDKLHKDIEKARKSQKLYPAWLFFKSLGISGAGGTVGKLLIDHFQRFDLIMTATKEKLLAVGGIGEITADSILLYFETHDLARLFKHVRLELPKQGKLTGITFVLTGGFDLGKKHYEKLIADAGGKVASSVGDKTNFLVLDKGKSDGSPSTKEKAAMDKNVPIISTADLMTLL